MTHFCTAELSFRWVNCSRRLWECLGLKLLTEVIPGLFIPISRPSWLSTIVLESWYVFGVETLLTQSHWICAWLDCHAECRVIDRSPHERTKSAYLSPYSVWRHPRFHSQDGCGLRFVLSACACQSWRDLHWAQVWNTETTGFKRTGLCLASKHKPENPVFSGRF